MTTYKPDDYATITPYLIVNNATKAIEFYKTVFGATVAMCMETPDKKIGHAELTIGDSKFMLADACPEMNAKSPEAFGGSPVGLHLYVKDVDAVAELAVKHGAKLVRKVENQFYGDRSGCLEDPFGHSWYIATHVEDVSEEELARRMQAMYK
ncbi:VOC family protein [Legionella clemsonensis]|uniref:Glyoxalase-like domain protein n=1 Tax=Legionella clemsonensis TaxID=1867846 RepID=A0A222P1V9_9GAMM|nr:VOC family protein [Legionella clemsonensis]ASQ45801.1 Glyoxalase-like domain protein [Legionella clemsonensis]